MESPTRKKPKRVLLLGPEKLTFLQKFWRDHSIFVKNVVSGTLAIVNATGSDGKFLFLDKIVIPIIVEIFNVASTPTPNDAALTHFAEHLFDGYAFFLRIGGSSMYFGTTSSSTILLNAEWVVAAEDAMESELVDLPATHCERFEANVHVIIGVQQVISQILRIVAERILEFEQIHRCAQPGSSKMKCYRSTPVKVGPRKVGKDSVVGDVGYAFEELMLGSHLRVMLDRALSASRGRSGCRRTWEPVRIYFEQCEQNKTKRSYESGRAACGVQEKTHG